MLQPGAITQTVEVTAGAPVNLDAIGAIASKVAVPLQLAGGVDGPDQIRLAFAAGATRVVLAMGIVDRPEELRACLEVAGDWLAVADVLESGLARSLDEWSSMLRRTLLAQ